MAVVGVSDGAAVLGKLGSGVNFNRDACRFLDGIFNIAGILTVRDWRQNIDGCYVKALRKGDLDGLIEKNPLIFHKARLSLDTEKVVAVWLARNLGMGEPWDRVDIDFPKDVRT